MTFFAHGKVVVSSAQYPLSRRSDGGSLGNGLQQLFDRAYIPGATGKLQLSDSVGRCMTVGVHESWDKTAAFKVDDIRM
jgi:hypothetical protein